MPVIKVVMERGPIQRLFELDPQSRRARPLGGAVRKQFKPLEEWASEGWKVRFQDNGRKHL